MSGWLDPWDDASLIAQRVGAPGARLVVVIGAEAWCAKCRTFRPVADDRARVAPSGESWVWLDVEDHAEFVGDELPDDLPWVAVYDNAVSTFSGAVAPHADGLSAALAAGDGLQGDLALFNRLAGGGWAR